LRVSGAWTHRRSSGYAALAVPMARDLASRHPNELTGMTTRSATAYWSWRVTMTYSSLNPDDIARRVGRSGMRVRKVLRQLYPSQAPGSGGRWLLTEEQVAAVLAYFGGKRTAGGGPAEGVVIRASAEVPADWFWEGHVQAVLVEHLRRQGWEITAISDTAARAQGEDVAAVKDGRHLVVEVKGYPSTGYRDPRRAAEVKRTNPTLQAKHWFADALLKLVRLRGTRPDVEGAMAFPDAPRYRSLIKETRGPLQQLGIGLYFVGADGTVEEVLPHARTVRSPRA
jgi:hypothetical protein